MSNKRGTTRIIVNTFFSLILLALGLWIGHKVTLSSYTYTESIIESEAARVTSNNVSKMNMIITNQTTIDDIASILYEDGFIANKNYFILEAKLEHATDDFIAGEYAISSNMSSTEILSLLTTNISDDEETIKFTIPEGYTIDQIAEVLENKNIVTKEEFLDAVKNRNYTSDYSFLRDMPLNRDYKYQLEGYLFPDTYIVRKNITSEEIVIMMLNRFESILSRYASYIQSSKYTIHDLLTIASIVEQEAKLDEERPMIAGVIYNRLDSEMRLQMCSTVQYSLNKRKTSLTLQDLEKDKPYNTYLYSGLPIGPICNPGEASIKAAIMPTIHDYYYFVLKDSDTGAHYFSTTSDEHNIAKSRYRQLNDINFTE